MPRVFKLDIVVQNKQKYVRSLVRPAFRRLNSLSSNRHWGNDNGVDEALSDTIFDLACSLRVPECCNRVKREFTHWMGQGEPDRRGANM